jgi:hypothetical protein
VQHKIAFTYCRDNLAIDGDDSIIVNGGTATGNNGIIDGDSLVLDKLFNIAPAVARVITDISVDSHHLIMPQRPTPEQHWTDNDNRLRLQRLIDAVGNNIITKDIQTGFEAVLNRR